jgi:hypothetical protein
MKRSCFLIGLAALTFLAAGSAGALVAQESPFIPEKLSRLLKDEISGDRAYNFVRRLTPYHRIMGSTAYVEAAEMLAGLARDFGFENVRVVRQKFEGGISWDPHSGRLWMVEPEEMKLCDFAEVPVSLAVFSRTARADAELVDIGPGASPEDFAGIDVAGKIVLTTASPGLAVRTAVWERGALGVVSCASRHPDARFDTPDQIAYLKVPASCPPGKTAPWGFMISPRQYGRLQDVLREAKARKTPVRVRAEIEAEVREPGEQAYLWAEIRGSEIHDQDIVLTAHLDEESTSANDNGSGCASILEIGRAINALIRDGRIARPRRDIVFWWPNEHTSEYQFLRENPEERLNWLAAINQDMVGARQGMGSRVQHIIRTPFSLPSYLSDVIESVAEYVILGNSAFLAAEEAGTPQPFGKPILSSLGSRDRYNAMVIPHSGASDQEVFCDSLVRVPGVALINNPDPFIHSSSDDLPNIDPTQLERNAFVVAATTLFLADARDGDVPMLAEEVHSRAVQRLGKDLNTALAHVRGNKAGSPDRSYMEARNLLERAGERERTAVESVLVFAAPRGPEAAFARTLAARIAGMASDLVRDLDAAFLRMAGGRKIPAPAPLSSVEKEMAARVPVNVGTLDEYFGRRGWGVDFPGLHPIMAKECYCFVDGKRSCLDIFRAVQAEALSAGEFYYGKVTPEAVRGLFDDAVRKGVLKFR